MNDFGSFPENCSISKTILFREDRAAYQKFAERCLVFMNGKHANGSQYQCLKIHPAWNVYWFLRLFLHTTCDFTSTLGRSNEQVGSWAQVHRWSVNWKKVIIPHLDSFSGGLSVCIDKNLELFISGTEIEFYPIFTSCFIFKAAIKTKGSSVNFEHCLFQFLKELIYRFITTKCRYGTNTNLGKYGATAGFPTSWKTSYLRLRNGNIILTFTMILKMLKGSRPTAF